MYIAENLKALRKKKEWTQEEMAEMIGVSPQSISKWERGDTYPDITLLPALANLYKVSVDFIIGMDKINEAEAQTAIFTTGHGHLRRGDVTAAAKVFSEALKTYPADESIMSELALTMALTSDQDKLKQAADLFERVLMGNPSEKVRHTTRAAICFVYYKMGEKDKAVAAAQNLPHLRESRENILSEFRDEPNMTDIDAYIRFIALGEDDAQDKIIIYFGINMIPICTEHDMPEKIKALRKEYNAYENRKGLRKLPRIYMRDNVELPPNRVKLSYYADLLLDDDFTDPADAVDKIFSRLSRK